MTPIFSELPRALGVYTLTRLIELRANTALYEARQTHVDRAVVLEVLSPEASHAEGVAFLAQARLRVSSSELPHVADVYESLRAEGIWFLTQELPLGRSLSDIAAAGESLTVPQICSIVAAAAEMYGLCAQVGLSAMPLAPSSVFIEDNGEVHFLSPLVEGVPNDPTAQMRTLAAGLNALFPQEKAPGLGRATTLLQWMDEGYEGQFFQWNELGETANTILSQLEAAAREAAEKSLLVRMKKRLMSHRKVQQIVEIFSKWGLYIGSAASIIIILSAMGTFFGMAAPEITTAKNETSILCTQKDQRFNIDRYPVTVQDYAEFLDAVESADDEQLDQWTQGTPPQKTDFTPQNWEAQWERGDIEAPVNGVSYWGALAYARYKGGELPTAEQLQTALAGGASSDGLEWTSSEVEAPLPGLYTSPAYLLVTEKGQIYTINSRDWSNKPCGFRIVTPAN